MAVDLGNTLQTAQNSTIRSPLIELRSVQTASAIPFSGNLFNYNTTDEYYPALITHSTGILISVWRRGTKIVLSYSDADHIVWTEVESLTYGNASEPMLTLDITELANGNIGVVFAYRSFNTKYLKYAILTKNGAVVQSPVTIETYGADYNLIGLSVTKLANDSYYMTYSRLYSGDYGVYRRSSSDFATWGAETEITTGFTDTYTHYETEIFQSATDDDLLLFVSYANEVVNDSEKVNVYLLVSTDNGSSWGAAAKITDFTVLGEGGFEAAVAENSSGQLLLSYADKTAVLAMTTETDLWQQECGPFAIGARIHYNEATGYLYSINNFTYVGIKKLCSVVVIDVQNWVVHRSYTTTTTPAYPTDFANNTTIFDAAKQEGKYVSVSINYQTIVINDDTETIAHYVWKDDGDHTRNITGLDFREYGAFSFSVQATAVVASEDRMYVVLANTVPQPRILIGYVDLTEGPVLGFYTWHEITWIEDWYASRVATIEDLLVLPNSNILSLSCFTTVDTWKGRTDIYALDTGNLVKEYSYDTDIGYPYNGIRFIEHYNGKLYGTFNYNDDYGQENHRGMVRIDLATHAISYLQPSYASEDDYLLGDKHITNDGIMLIAAFTNGLSTYNINTGAWSIYDNETAPDLDMGYENSQVSSVSYNEAEDLIYTGSPGAAGVPSFTGIRAFNLGGTLKRIQYRYGEKSGTWSFGEENLLVSGNYEQDPYPAYLTDDTLWLVWQRTDSSTQEKSIYYDNTVPELDLTPYLTEDAVTVSRSVKSPGKLSFTISKGHLFDQNNAASSLTKFLKKGRAITLRFGEFIDGIEYWSSQGTFYVDTFKMGYARGKYPSAKVSCIDRIALLKWAHTVASAHFDGQYPEAVIESLLLNHTNLSESEINIESFNTRHPIYYQVIDEKLLDALEEILDHFEVYLYAAVDNRVEARPVRFSGTIDNTYTDSTKLIEFTPDDNFSDYTNRVTVKGEGLNPVEVLYDEELLATYSGTGGWWEVGSETRDIYYSSDKKKKARNPRLEVLKSIKDFEILWQESEGTEYLLSEDPNGYFCTIVIEFPGLMWVLIGLIASVLIIGAEAITCDLSKTCGLMIFLFSIVISGVSYLLGQVATYDYEIYARPYGEEKQQYQASVDDLELQAFLDGLVIEQTIDDAFCYTQAECLRVATYEMNVIQSQRRRLSFNKIANIQDEPGDIIQMNHPFSGASLDVFLTDISRSYKRGTVRKKAGYFIDKIEGWRI